MARKRSLKSPQEASYRKEQNKLCMTRKRSLETIEESVKRKAADKSGKKSSRASQSSGRIMCGHWSISVHFI